MISYPKDVQVNDDSKMSAVRFVQSSPAINIVSVEKSNRKFTKKNQAEDYITYVAAALYAKCLVVLGIALPITGTLSDKLGHTYDIYCLYLYTCSILFLLYTIYSNNSKTKLWNYSHRYSISSTNSQSSNVYDRCTYNNQYIRYGSFYFRIGVTGFGIGSVIQSAIQLGQYFEFRSTDNCSNMLVLVKPLLRIVFALLQMLFIFSYSNYLDIQRNKLISKFGLMHMIATNLSEWLHVLVDETRADIIDAFESIAESDGTLEDALHELKDIDDLGPIDDLFVNSRTFRIAFKINKRHTHCLVSNVTASLLIKSSPYLSPCTVEYSLLCAVILSIMWKYACSMKNDDTNKINVGNGNTIMYSKTQNTISVDCAQSHKGLFGGILILATTIISLIMFFELVSHKLYSDIAVPQVNIWEGFLFICGTVASLGCIWTLRDLSFKKKKRDLELGHLLLLVTQSGVFMYFLFQVIGGFLMGTSTGKLGFLRIATPVAALVQSSCQTVLIMDARRRRCATLKQMRLKPGRQLITFLLVANIALWIVNRLKNNQAEFHPHQMKYFGVLAWSIITHVSMPLVVAYRFQSTVCFYEIWNHVYKMRSPANSPLHETTTSSF